jgi:hypothetical protein
LRHDQSLEGAVRPARTTSPGTIPVTCIFLPATREGREADPANLELWIKAMKEDARRVFKAALRRSVLLTP